MPEVADGLFFDFIFNFADNRMLQMERVIFPLPVSDGRQQRLLQKDDWQTEAFFMHQGYYTLLFDSERHMEAVKDTTINHAVVEKILLRNQTVRQYVFDRRQGMWMLTAIRTIPFDEAHHGTFLNFYHQFATDKDFQRRHLDDTVYFVGPDPDDDFSQMEGTISPDSWEAFAPELPSELLYNIVYGTPSKEGKTMVFVLRGIANGQELQMNFRRVKNDWRLTKLTT